MDFDTRYPVSALEILAKEKWFLAGRKIYLY
jgi:hypothetical protein